MLDRFALVGRDPIARELELLIDGLPRAGGAIVLRGEPGIGKSALGEHAISLAEQRGLHVLSVTAIEGEAQMPFAALEHLVRPHHGALSQLRPRQRDALETALGMRSGAAPDIFLVGLAVLDLLSEIGLDRGLVVFLDDVHWIDVSTAQVLRFVARRIRSESVAMLLAIRRDQHSPLLESNLAVIDVLPLNREQSLDLLERSRPHLGRRARDAVLEIAGGNPLALLELAPAHSDGDGTHSPVMTERLMRAFAAKLEGLDDASAAVVLVAAASDNTHIREILAATVVILDGTSPEPIAMQELAATGAVVVTGDALRFRHPLVRAAVIEMAPPARLRAAHAALALTLASAPDRAAWHEAESVIGPDAHAASALARVADRARAQGNPAVVMRAMLRSARLSVTPDDRAHRLLRAAEAAIELGRLDRAVEISQQVETHELSAHDRARVALLRDSLDEHSRGETRIEQLVLHAQTALDHDDTDLAVSLLLAAGGHLNGASFGINASDAKSAAARLARRLGDGDPRVLAVWAAIDPLAYARVVTERVAAMDATNLDPRMDVLIGAAFVVDADPGLAGLQTALIDSYRVRGRLRSIAHLQTMHCWTQIALANLPEALASADEGVRLSHEVQLPRREAGAIVGQAMIAAMSGDDDRARRLIAESELIARTRGAQDVLTGVQLTKGVRLLALGRHDEALSALKRSFDPEDPSFHPLQALWSLGDVAEAGYHSGRVPEVRRIFERVNFDGVSTPWQRMAEQYAQPFLATDHDHIEAAFASALGGIVGHWPGYRARLLLEYGRWLRLRSRVPEARDVLRAAREAADTLGMRPWAEQARRELRAAGEDSSAFTPRAWALLSPQELLVARMAGEGLSNKEIAERLFLSHRTVGSHLYRIFPKLGVANRAQLAAIIGSQPIASSELG